MPDEKRWLPTTSDLTQGSPRFYSCSTALWGEVRTFRQRIHSSCNKRTVLDSWYPHHPRRLISRCLRCLRLFSVPGTQRMADLPKERLATDEAPFTIVGVGCFCHFMTKCGRKQHKRYGCIFTCLTSTAVHLEALNSMNTSSFINALQLFPSRRGCPNNYVVVIMGLTLQARKESCTNLYSAGINSL